MLRASPVQDLRIATACTCDAIADNRAATSSNPPSDYGGRRKPLIVLAPYASSMALPSSTEIGERLAYALQQLINGVTLGMIYGLIAVGYTMVYGIIGMINFAHGDVFIDRKSVV